MFWKGKVSLITHIQEYLNNSEVKLIRLDESNPNLFPGKCTISTCTSSDLRGISDLLNEWFEDPQSKTKAQTTSDWIRSTLHNKAIWIVGRDSGNTVRGCVSSFLSESPYPSQSLEMGIVDWFCVHPLWRSKGLGSALLETLDVVTYRMGRKAHIFLKEGMPLPLPHIPIFCSWLKCRRAGNPKNTEMNHINLILYNYQEVERSTGIPLIRVEGVKEYSDVEKWEEALDELPECWIFVSGNYLVDDKKGWTTDSLVSMYAFRWSPGKWLGTCPSQHVI
jgi:GNAT superfamily N-acetyltransferase